MKNFLFTLLSIVLAGPAGAVSLDSGMIAHYPFDGDAKNQVSNQWHGMVSGAVLTKDRFGIDNAAYAFDGVDDYIEMARSYAMVTDTFSISCWVYFEIIKPQNVVGKALDHAGNYESYQDLAFATNYYGELSAHVTSEWGVPYSSKTVLDATYKSKEWLHLVMTWDGDTMKAYLDGDLTDVNVSTNNFRLSARFLLSVGGSSKLSTIKPDRFLKGMVDDIRVYNIVIGDEMVDDLYNAKDKRQVAGLTTRDQVSIQVVPNPSSGYFSIESNTDVLQVEIFDHQGRHIITYSGTLPDPKYQYYLPGGFYFVQVRTRQGMLVEKLIIR